MRDFNVVDLCENRLHESYSVGIFTCSDEPRCTVGAERFAHSRVERALLLAREDENQALLDNVTQVLGRAVSEVEILELASNDTRPLRMELQRLSEEHVGNFRVFVDYSSMPHMWLAAMLSWLHDSDQQPQRTNEIDAIYTISGYRPDFHPLKLDGIVAVPGCEEPLDASTARKLLVFGLGFDGIAASEVLEEMQPSTIYCYLADPVPFPEYADRARKENRDLLRQSRAQLALPLRSVRSAFAYLSEMVTFARLESRVSFVPMGPKPHVLAATLVAMRFDDVGCFYVTGRRDKPESVSPTENSVITRIRVQRPSESELVQRA